LLSICKKYDRNSFSAISNGNSGDDGVVDSSEDGGPVHIFLHCGNLLSVDSGGGGGIKMKAMEAFESLIREDSGRDSWVGNLEEIEQIVHKMYRKVFSNSRLRKIMRNCSCIFIPGDGEAGMDTCQLLSQPSVTNNEPKRRKSIGKYSVYFKH
jgi:hypothetical protein